MGAGKLSVEGGALSGTLGESKPSGGLSCRPRPVASDGFFDAVVRIEELRLGGHGKSGSESERRRPLKKAGVSGSSLLLGLVLKFSNVV